LAAAHLPLNSDRTLQKPSKETCGRRGKKNQMKSPKKNPKKIQGKIQGKSKECHSLDFPWIFPEIFNIVGV